MLGGQGGEALFGHLIRHPDGKALASYALTTVTAAVDRYLIKRWAVWREEPALNMVRIGGSAPTAAQDGYSSMSRCRSAFKGQATQGVETVESTRVVCKQG
jgi:hypothetical protein